MKLTRTASLSRLVLAVAAITLSPAVSAQAQTETVLYNFVLGCGRKPCCTRLPGDLMARIPGQA